MRTKIHYNWLNKKKKKKVKEEKETPAELKENLKIMPNTVQD